MKRYEYACKREYKHNWMKQLTCIWQWAVIRKFTSCVPYCMQDACTILGRRWGKGGYAWGVLGWTSLFGLFEIVGTPGTLLGLFGVNRQYTQALERILGTVSLERTNVFTPLKLTRNVLEDFDGMTNYFGHVGMTCWASRSHFGNQFSEHCKLESICFVNVTGGIPSGVCALFPLVTHATTCFGDLILTKTRTQRIWQGEGG